MKAGRELDKLIATDVFGWKWDDNTDLWISNHCLYTDMDIPNYSTNIADAWIVLEKLRESKILLDMLTDINGFRFEVVYWGEGIKHVVQSETAPLGICLAALKAVGVDVE